MIHWEGLRERLFNLAEGYEDECLQSLQLECQQAFDAIQKHAERYLDSLCKQASGTLFDRSRQIKNKTVLLQACALSPFIKQLRKKTNAPHLQFLQGSLDPNAVLHHLNILKLAQKITHIETITEKKIPIPDLCQWKNEKKIKHWLNALDKSKQKTVPHLKGDQKNPFVKVHYFHRFLSLFCHLLKLDLASLETNLYRLGCAIFSKNDPHIIEEGEAVIGEGKVTLGSTTYVLGDLLTTPGVWPMEIEIEEDPFHKIVLYQNEAILIIQQALELNQYAVLKPQIKEKNLRATIAKVEHCSDSLGTFVWKSQEDLHPDDEDQAFCIVALIQGLMVQDFTPEPLDPENFAFNEEDDMRCLVDMHKSPKSFEAIVKFAWECTKKNIPVYQHLMNKSGASTSIFALDYVLLLQNALNNVPDRKIKDPAIDAFRKQFYQTIQETKRDLSQEISSEYVIFSQGSFNSTLNEAINTAYQAYNSPLLVPDFKERCKKLALMRLAPPMNPVHLSPLRDRLIQEFTQQGIEPIPFEKHGIFNIQQTREIELSATISRNLHLKINKK